MIWKLYCIYYYHCNMLYLVSCYCPWDFMNFKIFFFSFSSSDTFLFLCFIFIFSLHPFNSTFLYLLSITKISIKINWFLFFIVSCFFCIAHELSCDRHQHTFSHLLLLLRSQLHYPHQQFVKNVRHLPWMVNEPSGYDAILKCFPASQRPKV